MSSPPTESTRLLNTQPGNSHENNPSGSGGIGSRGGSHARSRPVSQASGRSHDSRLKPSIYDGLNQHLGYNVTAPPAYLGSVNPDLGLGKSLGPDQYSEVFEGEIVDINSDYSISQVSNECYFIFRMALPIVFSYILQNSIPLGSVFSLGHLGPTQLAASALSNMFATVTGWSVAMGMATALDTLCSQAFTGSPDPHAVGVHLQRGILISLTLMIPVGILWWEAEYILLLLKLDPELASFCGRYLRVLLFGAPPYVIFECLKKFLQAQEIMTAPTYVLISVVPINILLNFLLVWYPPTSLGFDGAPLAVALTNWFMMTFCILYIYFVRGSSAWGGWTKRSLSGWWPFLKLGIPGIIMICAEWWAFEIMGLAASYLGQLPLAAHAVNITTCNLFYMVPLGLSIASSNRMGNLLGDKTPNRARLCAYCSTILALMFAFLNSTVLIVFRDFWAYLFTNDDGVAKLARTLLPICALFQVFDGLSGVSGGLLRGQGRQKLGAIVNVIAYYGISIPLGLTFAFVSHWGVHGLWWGLSIALFLSASTLTYSVLNTDWPREVAACQERLNAEEAERGYQSA